MKNLEKMLAIFLLLTGLSIISIWIALMITGQVPGIHEKLIGFVFHWVSELLLAVLSIYTAVLLFKNKLNIKLLVFLNLGLLLCSTFQASLYYAINQSELLMFLFILTFFIISLFFTRAGFKKFYVIGMSRGQGMAFNYAFLFFGILIYYMLNLAGDHLQAGEIGAFLIDIFILLNTVYFAIVGLKKSRFSLNL